MATEIEARDLLYRRLIANGPYTVPAQVGIPEAVTLDASPSPIWSPRNVVLGNELAPAVPDHFAAWATVRVEHDERVQTALKTLRADVLGYVFIMVRSRLGDQSAEAIASLLARAIANVLDPQPEPLRFRDGAALYLLGALTDPLPLGPKAKWHRVRVEAPFTWQDRGGGRIS